MRINKVDEILHHYGVDVNALQPRPGEVYAISLSGLSDIHLYQDDRGWLHIMTEFNADALPQDEIYESISWFNDFNVAHPQFVLGVNRENAAVVLHSRLPGDTLSKVQAIEYFEQFVDKASTLQHHFCQQEQVK